MKAIVNALLEGTIAISRRSSPGELPAEGVSRVSRHSATRASDSQRFPGRQARSCGGGPKLTSRNTGWRMSEENVEIVREVLALIRRAGTGEPEPRLFELFSTAITLDFSRRAVNPDVYEGYGGLRRFRQDRDEVWEEFLVTPEQFVDAGDAVVVVESIRARGRGSGVEVTIRSTSVWTVRDGRVIHVGWYYDQRAALRAAGIAHKEGDSSPPP
jgi:ketosteroid isomerase-like protein